MQILLGLQGIIESNMKIRVTISNVREKKTKSGIRI